MRVSIRNTEKTHEDEYQEHKLASYKETTKSIEPLSLKINA